MEHHLLLWYRNGSIIVNYSLFFEGEDKRDDSELIEVIKMLANGTESSDGLMIIDDSIKFYQSRSGDEIDNFTPAITGNKIIL